MTTKLFLGSDHGGFQLKSEISKFLAGLNDSSLQVVDLGTDSTARCDYPDYGRKVAEHVVQPAEPGTVHRGIVFCGSGIGISIAANKVPRARCALCHDHYSALMARKHNDANILAMGGRNTGVDVAEDMVRVFLETPFEGGRHTARVAKLDEAAC